MSQLSCSFAIFCGTECDFSSRWPGRQQLIPLNSCADVIKEHLRDVDVSQSCVGSEKKLILARVGLFEDDDGRDFTICPKHRAVLGVRFRPSKKCQHPLHGNRKGKGDRGVNLKTAKEIKEKWNTVVPVGADKHTQLDRVKPKRIDHAWKGRIGKEGPPTRLWATWVSQTRPQSSLIEPLPTSIGALEFVLPRLRVRFQDEILSEQSDPNSDIFSSSSQGSLVEEETSREWQPTPQVEHQLQHLNSYLLKSTDGRISPVRSQCRSDVVTMSSSTRRYYGKKAEQIVDSVLDAIAPGNSSWLLQQVIARNQSGRTVSGAAEEDNLVSRLVTLYNEARSWNTQQQILSLFAGDYSKTELLQLVCSASQKKSLVGLDSMQTDDVTAISSLEVVTSILQKNGFQDEEAKGVLSRLKAGKRYVSTDYKLHIATETPCVDHCSMYALSSNEAEYRGTCSHQHNINCDRCSDLRNAVLDIQVAVSELQLSNDEKREELQHDLEAAIPKLDMWKSHVIRSVHQDAAKTANWFAVASIIENTLETLKALKPNLNQVYLRSDNAGCYHCAYLLLSLPSIGDRTGVTIARYDFSEPQAGKDICDRRTAAIKSHIRRFLNEGNDVKSANDMKTAIESYGGIKGCYAAVCLVQPSAQTMSKHNMAGIQSLHNFSYENGGIRVWRAYNVGPGKFYSAAQLARFGTPQGPTKLVIIHPFGRPHVEVEEGCIKTFQSFASLQRHLDVGTHMVRLVKESTYDEIRRKWAEACHSLGGGYVWGNSATFDSSDQAMPGEVVELGWAIQKNRKPVAFSEKAKSYLVDVFWAGEETEKKANASFVASRMKSLRDENGQKMFTKTDWLTEQQIARYFSRLSALNKAGRLQRTHSSLMNEDEEADADDLVVEAEAVRTRQQIRRDLEL
ncbi:unnamed protein product [Porites evermanni]|uniref:Uncharacterized protein n=1 Tax=Porites evermanni TaxID=104178 RepID=A0ABN8LX14_9CNID|nr:unnamed protein product [Porites evermanni]